MKTLRNGLVLFFLLGGCAGTTSLSYGPQSGWENNSRTDNPCDSTTSPYEQAARCSNGEASR